MDPDAYVCMRVPARGWRSEKRPPPAPWQVTAGSRILSDYTAPYDAHAVSGLRDAGAVVLGKTNLDAFGMGSSTENSASGPTRNPWAPALVPGGSSGGSAAAVAAGLCAAALGSDTGGSVRQPAAFCGVLGLKPTYGRVSRRGLIAYASSLDTVGVLARSAADAAEVLGAIAGHDAGDATSAQVEPFCAGARDFLSPEDMPSAPLAGLRIGIVRETTGAGVQDAVAQGLQDRCVGGWVGA